MGSLGLYPHVVYYVYEARHLVEEPLCFANPKSGPTITAYYEGLGIKP